MIITLKGANFASSNIGTLDSWLISKSLTGVTIDNTATSVKKGEAYKAVITLKENYTFPDTITVTMGGTDITSTYVTKTATTITINIPSVTGNIVIRVNAISVGTSTDQYTVTYNLKGVRSGNTTTAVNKESTYISKIAVLTNSALTSTPAVSYTITMGGTQLTVDTDYTISNIGSYEKLLTIEKVTGDLVINIEARHSTPSSIALEAGKWPNPNQSVGSAIQYYPTITSDSSTLMYMTVPSNVHVYTYMDNVRITGTSTYSSIVLRPSASDTVIEYYKFNNSSRGHHFKSYSYETQLYYHSSVLTTSYMYPADTSTLVTYTITAYPSTATINVNNSGSSIPLARANGTLTFTAPAGTTITYGVGLEGYTAQSETITLTQSGTNSKVVTLVKEETGGGITPGTPDTYTFTINPTPSNATVTLTASGYTQKGNSISVPSGTVVTYTTAAEKYKTRSDETITITENTTKEVALAPLPYASGATIPSDGVVPENMFIKLPDTWMNGSVTSLDQILVGSAGVTIGYNCCYLPINISGYTKIDLTAQTTAACYYQFFNADGKWTMTGVRQKIDKGASQTVTIPSNAKYLILADSRTNSTDANAVNGYLKYFPVSVKIY